MILSMNLSNYRKCKLWINERGDLPYSKEESVLEQTVTSSTSRTPEIVQMAFELSLPRNASNYALIGFEYNQDIQTMNCTKIAVFVCKERIEYLRETVAKPNDKVLMGISEEYAQSILDSVVETLEEIGGTASGEFRVNIGAHAECGSSKAIFSKASKVLVKLSKLDLLNMTEAEIQNIVEAML